MNVHPALLPAFPGAHAVEDALAAGASRQARPCTSSTKASTPGGCFARRPSRFCPATRPRRLHARIQTVEHRILPEVVRELIAA